jgi:hypothetical protein
MIDLPTCKKCGLRTAICLCEQQGKSSAEFDGCAWTELTKSYPPANVYVFVEVQTTHAGNVDYHIAQWWEPEQSWSDRYGDPVSWHVLRWHQLPKQPSDEQPNKIASKNCSIHGEQEPRGVFCPVCIEEDEATTPSQAGVSTPPDGSTFFACGPQKTCPDGTEHDWSGTWISEDGRQGSAVCSKCGHMAIDDAFWMP